MGYGTLEHAFWEDPDLQELGLEGLAVAAYVLTCRHSTSEGYYRLALGYVCEDLRVNRDTALGYLRALDLKNFARFDEISQVIFVRNAMRYRPPKGTPSITGALRRACDVPVNPFRGLFYDAACQWAPDFAAVLREAGWASDATETVRSPQLFEDTVPVLPEPKPLPVPVRPAEEEVVDTVMRCAADLSVQQSIARREVIRNAEAVARARLAKHVDVWRPIVQRWLTMFDGVPPSDMAKALVDGGTPSPYWKRASAPA